MEDLSQKLGEEFAEIVEQKRTEILEDLCAKRSYSTELLDRALPRDPTKAPDVPDHRMMALILVEVCARLNAIDSHIHAIDQALGQIS